MLWIQCVFSEVEKESSSSSTKNETSNSWVDKIGSYLGKSINQLIKGNYTDDVTLLGTGMQVGTGILGIDVLADIRDVSADFAHWEWSWGHAGQTILDAVGIVPLIGAVKYTDEVAEHITNITNENILDQVDDISKSGTVSDLDGIRIINKKYAGKTYELSGDLATKDPSGVKFMSEGFPNFEPYSINNVTVNNLEGDSY